MMIWLVQYLPPTEPPVSIRAAHKNEGRSEIEKGELSHLPSILLTTGIERNYEHPDLRDLMFGKSPVNLAQQLTTKAAKKVYDHLAQAQTLHILAPSMHLDQANLTHAMNSGSSFCKMIAPQGEAWYVHPSIILPRRPDGQKHKTIPLDQATLDPEKQVIHVGMCMFGASSVLAEAENGAFYHLTDAREMESVNSRIKRISVRHTLHPYEMETTLRITGYLKRAFSHRTLQIHLHVPRLEYWLFGLPLYEEGLLEKELLLRWFNEVDRRARKIGGFFTKAAPGQATLQLASPLRHIENLLLEWVSRGERGLTGRMLECLAAVDHTWQAILTTADALARKEREEENQSYKQAKFKTFSEMNAIDIEKLSYVIGALKAFEESNGSVIAVYGPEELPILLHAGKLLRVPDNHKAFLGFYVHPNFFVPPDRAINNKPLLFWYDDSDDQRTRVRLVREIYRLERIREANRPIDAIL